MKTSPIETVRKTEASIKKGQLDKALDTLLIYFTECGDKQSVEEVRILISKLSNLKRDKKPDGEFYQKEENSITDAILSLRSSILPEDVRPAAPPVYVYKNGRLLHDIPPSMQVGNPVRCVIRLAPERASLLQVFEPSENTVFEKIERVGGITRLAIQPLNKQDFKVQMVGQPDRNIFSDVYKEWIFFITPLREGRLHLHLDVGMTILDATGEHSLEKVFTEEIDVMNDVLQPQAPMRAVAAMQGSAAARSKMPWWVSLFLMFPYAVKSMPRVASIIIGLFFGARIALILFPANTKEEGIQLKRYQTMVSNAHDEVRERPISTALFHPPANINFISRPAEYGVPKHIYLWEYLYSDDLDPATLPRSPLSPKPTIVQPTTRVSLSLPKKTKNIKVLVNGRAVTSQLVTRGSQFFVDFTVLRSQKAMAIKATDEYCTYEAAGTPSAAELVLSSQSACSQRLVELTLNKDLGAFLNRNKQDVVIEARNDRGERMGITDLQVANPLKFYVPGASMQVLIKLKLSSGNAINVCSMTLPAGKQAVIKSTCTCEECATQVK